MAPDLHDGAFVSAVVGDSSVLVEVANTAVVAIRPVPRSATKRAVRVAVSARVVAHTSSDTVAVGVRAVVFVAAVQRIRKNRRNISRSEGGWYTKLDRRARKPSKT